MILTRVTVVRLGLKLVNMAQLAEIRYWLQGFQMPCKDVKFVPRDRIAAYCNILFLIVL